MGKKKSPTRSESTQTEPDRRQYLVSCQADDWELFERISALEGDKTVQQWLLRLGRIRARRVIEAEKNGTLEQL